METPKLTLVALLQITRSETRRRYFRTVEIVLDIYRAQWW